MYTYILIFPSLMFYLHGFGAESHKDLHPGQGVLIITRVVQQGLL